jgi:hypothetical protein
MKKLWKAIARIFGVVASVVVIAWIAVAQPLPSVPRIVSKRG